MFLDKLKSFFRKNDGKEKLKIEYASPRNEYYGKVAERYGTLQMVLLVALTLFILIALMINSSWISYENFYFFFTDFGNYLTTADSDIENVIYDTGNFYDFDMFEGKLAVAGSGGVALYTSSGRTALESNEIIASPQIESSQRYMMVYDLGGKEYRIYNLFTEVHSADTQYSVYGAAVADNGSYAIITGNGRHISCVEIYNRKFELIQSIGRASYVVDVSLSPSGDRSAVLSYTQKDGRFLTRLYLTKTSKTEGYADITVDGVFPLYCAFTEKGYVNVVCSDRVLSYNTSGKLVSEYIFSENAKLSCVDINRYGCAVVLNEGNSFTQTVLDRGGKVIYTDTSDKSIEDVKLYGKYLYLLGARDVIRVNIQNGNEDVAERSTYGDVQMVVNAEDSVLLCMPSRVRYIKF